MTTARADLARKIYEAWQADERFTAYSAPVAYFWAQLAAAAVESALLAERRRAIEEAAQLADKMQQAAAAVLADGHDDDAATQHDTAMEIAQAIRSLASPRDETTPDG